MRILSVDVGGTSIKYALIDSRRSDFLEKGSFPTPLSGRSEFVRSLTNLYSSFCDLSGLAVSMPGIIDSRRGYCAMGGALSYNNDFYLLDALSETISVPIVINNDAKCAAMAEASVGSLKDVCDGMVLILGTMIGGGIIHNHKLLMGKHFSAGEVSYIIPNDSVPVRRESFWGNRCGTPELCRLYAARAGIPVSDVDGQLVFSRYDAGDLMALEALKEYTYRIAVQIFNFQTVLDSERIAIGGGISVQPSLLEHIRKNLDNLYAECPYTVPHADVVRCEFGNDANLIGAMQFFLNENRRSN